MIKNRLELFDTWASDYDPANDTAEFPFTGYEHVLNAVAELTGTTSGLKILDLGTGTGNLLRRFDAAKNELWGTDFSSKMIAQAKTQFEAVNFLQLDLLAPEIPAELPRDFDVIVSAYVMHEFPLDKKLDILQRYSALLKDDGGFLIADIAFETQSKLDDAYARWKNMDPDEHCWVADSTISILQEKGFSATYMQISSCAGVFGIKPT